MKEDHGINMNKVNDLDKKVIQWSFAFLWYFIENIPNEIKRDNDFGVAFFIKK